MMTRKSSHLLALIGVVAVLAFAGLEGCTTTSGAVALPKLSPAQLQQLTTQVCAALNADLTLLEGPTGKSLLTPGAMTKVTTIVGPTVAAVCASGASIDPTSLQTLNNTVVPALIDIVAAVPSIPDQPEILAGLTLAEVALVPIVNQALAAAAASSAPSAAPVAAPPTTDITTPGPTPVSSRALSVVESPPVVGAASSALLVACLQAFGHISVAAPAAAAITVFATLGAAYLNL